MSSSSRFLATLLKGLRFLQNNDPIPIPLGSLDILLTFAVSSLVLFLLEDSLRSGLLLESLCRGEGVCGSSHLVVALSSIFIRDEQESHTTNLRDFNQRLIFPLRDFRILPNVLVYTKLRRQSITSKNNFKNKNLEFFGLIKKDGEKTKRGVIVTIRRNIHYEKQSNLEDWYMTRLVGKDGKSNF